MGAALKPCPFCGVEVKRFDQPDLPGIIHPENDCLLGGELWSFDKVERWNARAASAMSAGTAETQSGSGLQPASAVPERADAPTVSAKGVRP